MTYLEGGQEVNLWKTGFSFETFLVLEHHEELPREETFALEACIVKGCLPKDGILVAGSAVKTLSST